MLINFLLVAAGGALGSMLRYGASLAIGKHIFPWATLAVNITGCFIIGILYALFSRYAVTEKQWLLLAAGVCGGFTTFSAFGAESLRFIQQQQYGHLLLYAGVSIVAGLAATAAGYGLAK